MGQKVKLKEKLGAGGTAEVFRAEIRGDGGFSKQIAVKRLLPHFIEEQKLLDMFIDEARILSKLTHPNIVQVFNFQRSAGQYLLFMEYVHGTSLARLLHHFRGQEEGLPLSAIAYIAAEAAAGLDYAHRKTDEEGRPLHIIHRDISPDNILLSVDGQVKVVDFGIAKAADRTTRTARGRIKGKTFYMAPERLRHVDEDARMDLFSLGLVIHEMLAGRRLFERANEPEVFFAIMAYRGLGSADRPEGVPEELWRIVTRAMEPEPKDRYARASDMAEALETFRLGLSKVAGPAELAALVRSARDAQASVARPASVDEEEQDLEDEEISGMVTHPNRRMIVTPPGPPVAEEPPPPPSADWAPDPFEPPTRNELPRPDEIETHFDQHLPFLADEVEDETSREMAVLSEKDLDGEVTDMEVPDLGSSGTASGRIRSGGPVSQASTVSFKVDGERNPVLVLILVVFLFLAAFGLVWFLLHLFEGPKAP